MRNLSNPRWLFFINTLPMVVLFVLLYSQFNIIKTLLDDNNIKLWQYFGFTLGALWLLNFAYPVYLMFKKQHISVWYGVIVFCCYIPYLYLYGFFLEDIIPFSVPRWMISGGMFLYVGTFLMPTLAHAMFFLISYFTPENKEHKAWINFAIAIGIPVMGYLFAQIIIPLWQHFDSQFSVHSLLVLTIVATIVFLFFLVRGIFIIATQKSAVWLKYQLAWKIPIAIVLPLLGLLLNNGHLSSIINPGIFGDFNNPWFYILAVVNGVLVCLPNLDNKLYRICLFVGRSITFAFTSYFFIVFLPFLPFSVVAIIAIGTGFLMLTPLLLFVIHVNELSKDVTYFKNGVSTKLLVGVSVLCFLIIPTIVTTTYMQDRRILNETLAYVYSPDYSKKYDIDKISLQRTLDMVKHYKGDNRNLMFDNKLPYLSAYFNWLVLDNLTLSDLKINTIEKIFFGTQLFEPQPEMIRNENVKITNIGVNSTYDQSQMAWKSWVDLEITNKSSDNAFAEYATTIDLPDACWISDYYLYVGDKKEFGLLAEKKAAMWVFSQIRNERRDPGILYYLTGNKVVFRVFPFFGNEVRKTGIEFLHKEPIKITIDGNIVQLENHAQNSSQNVETENMVYVSAQQKQSLPVVQRKPYFHFLVDVSKDKDIYADYFVNRIEKLAANNPSLSQNAQISFVNSYVSTVPLNGDWKQNYQAQAFEGGFYLDRAIRHTLFDAYKNKSYPVMVVVTDNIQRAVLDKDFSDFEFAFPESNLFFNLTQDGKLEAHSLTENPAKQLPDSLKYSFDQAVLAYKLSDNSIAYLPNNNEPSIVLKKDVFEISDADMKEKNWQSALTMQGQWIAQTLHPETSDKQWLNLVKYSFVSKVMTPVTSYLVVENEAQKAILKKKQEQALSGNKALDLGEDPQRMSEPSLILLVILLIFVLWYKEKRKRQQLG